MGFPEKVQNDLRNLMVDSGMTIRGLAKRISVLSRRKTSYNAVYQWLNGIASPTPSRFKALVKILEAPDSFLEEARKYVGVLGKRRS